MEKISNNPIINFGVDQPASNQNTQANKYLATNQTNFNQGSMSDKTLFNSGDQMRTRLDGQLQLLAQRFSNAERSVIDRRNPSNFETTYTRGTGDVRTNNFTIRNVTTFVQGDTRWGNQPYRFANPNSTRTNMLEEACSITAYTNAINAVNSDIDIKSDTINPQDTNLRSPAFQAAVKNTRAVDLLGNNSPVLDTGRRQIPITLNNEGVISLQNGNDKKYTAKIVEELKKGNPVLIGLSSPDGHRHTVTAYGVKNGEILVMDAGGGDPPLTTLSKIAKDWRSDKIDMLFSIRKR
jgi:hypothetical protein